MGEVEELGWICSFGEHDEMGKGRCMHDSLKIHKNTSKILVKKFFSKNFFRSKIFEKFPFLAIFAQKFDKSSEHDEMSKGTSVCDG